MNPGDGLWRRLDKPFLLAMNRGCFMRRFAIALTALAAAVVLLAGWPAASPANAAVNLNVHVHDDFYHPAGYFNPGPGTDHFVAKANCQGLNPAPTCDALITGGDTITWVAPAPLATNLHTVTECTDGTFTVCGPAVSLANPIGDSGVRAPPSPGPSGWPYGAVTFNDAGTYFYRCEVHQTTMRGRVIVLANTAVGGDVLVFTDSSSGSVYIWALVGTAALAMAAAGGTTWRRNRRRAEAEATIE
jgi:plastocyanin